MESRCNDFIYDPLFVVSCEKDYYKEAMKAQLINPQFAIRLNYNNMFSELPHMPRHSLVRRRIMAYPSYEQRFDSEASTAGTCIEKVDVLGIDRHRYFDTPFGKEKKRSKSPIKKTLVRLPAVPDKSSPERGPKVTANKKIQTRLRESSVQTCPWEPSFEVMDAGEEDPELLLLDYLKWNSGLPAGMHEVTLIERARMKRAWVKALPPITGPESLKERKRAIEKMENEEWAFRDSEIQDVQDLRLDLLKRMLNELLALSKTRSERKLESFTKMRNAEADAKIGKIRHTCEREVRKLKMKEAGYAFKYKCVDPIEEHINKTSELYGPLMRHGEHPKRWHQVIDDHLKSYHAQFLGVERMSTLPRWYSAALKATAAEKLKLPGTRLCVRETKWTTPVLKQLHEELKNLHEGVEKRKCEFTRIEHEIPEPATPRVERLDEWEEKLHQAVVVIQSALRGRASQILLFEGRNRCRELIEELRSTHALQAEDMVRKFNRRLEVKSNQREDAICGKNVVQLRENLARLSGTIVGSLLDFLNKELRRLLEERRTHAMCLLFERERQKREAAEAGRRQCEMRRRREHDEMYKQVVKVHQDTTEVYLQEIVTEGLEFVSDYEARQYIERLAQRIDDEAYSSRQWTFSENEELIANLVHNFLLPDIEKQIVREKIKARQKNYLATAHKEIYDKLATMTTPSWKNDNDDSSLNSSDITLLNVNIDKKEELEDPAHSSVDQVDVLFTADDPTGKADTVSIMRSIMEPLEFKQHSSATCKKLPIMTDRDTSSVQTVRLSEKPYQQTNLDLQKLKLHEEQQSKN